MFKAGHKKLVILIKSKVLQEFLHQSKVILTVVTFSLSSLSIAFFVFTGQVTTPEPESVKGTTTHISLDAPTIPTHYPTPTILPSPAPHTPTPEAIKPQSTITPNSATQIDDVTWTVDVEGDPQTASPQEIFTALNSYRAKNGKSKLTWDPKLASYAQNRADLFAVSGATDKHAGFNSYLDGNGFSELGFNSIGENSSHGYHVSGTKLIEEVYSSDAPHNNNQLADKWTHVGVGVNGVATDLIFAGNKQ